MHLAQQAYCDNLVSAGVDEYFVSVAGPDATIDRRLNLPGSRADIRTRTVAMTMHMLRELLAPTG